MTYLRVSGVTPHGGDGIVPFNFKPPKKVKLRLFVTATTANDSTGDTSEFSAPNSIRSR
jgi:hypothetical protein